MRPPSPRRNAGQVAYGPRTPACCYSRQANVEWNFANVLYVLSSLPDIPMPVFTDLEIRVTEVPFDNKGYQSRLPQCQSIGQTMPLVHVSGRERTFEITVQTPPQEIPTSEDQEYYSDLTRAAEDRLGLPRSAYLYAGRAPCTGTRGHA